MGMQRSKAFLFLSFLSLLGILMGLGRITHATIIENFHTRGPEADATWDSSDDCVFSTATLQIFSSTTLGANHNSTPLVYFSVFSSDFCNNLNTLISGTATDGVQVTAGQGLKSASVTGTIPIEVCVGEVKPVDCEEGHTATLDIHWSATGNATRTQLVQSTQTSTGMIRTRLTGSVAPALATGTIKEDETLDLISGPSTFANLSSSDFGSLIISHP